jgi:hypothetical protein
MTRIRRLILLVIIAIVAGGFSWWVANIYISSVTDDVAKATIAAGVITLFGVIFSAMYNEISTYYKDRSANINRKWDLIFPMMKNHYNPWVNIAYSYIRSLKRLDIEHPSDENFMRVLYLTLIFFGLHMKFVLDDGGLILLSTPKEEKTVSEAYYKIEDSYVFAGDQTPRLVSHLDDVYLSKGVKGGSGYPYVLEKFKKDLETDPVLQESMQKLKAWMNKDNKDNLMSALQNFADTFKASLDRLYTAWGD